MDLEVPTFGQPRTYAGLPVDLDVAIAAGPVLNANWGLYYASLGFDVITYKTVRSHFQEVSAWPNVWPCTMGGMTYDGLTSNAAGENLAVKFGMPCPHPEVWRADVRNLRDRLDPKKILVVSVAGFGDTAGEIVEDFAKTAAWAVEAGADAIEANISCPNVHHSIGQIYQNLDLTSCVAGALRRAVGDRPLLLKIGENPKQLAKLECAVRPFDVWFVTTNCPSRQVKQRDGLVQCGVAGPYLREASLEQVRALRDLDASVIGVGGISTIWDVFDYLKAGAESVQVASAAMRNPTFVHDLKVAISQSSGLVTT